MYYAITATVTCTREDGATTTRQVPTFYLHENVQGITDRHHAERIATEIIDPFGERRVVSVYATALPDA